MTGDLEAGDFGWLVARPIAHRGLHDAAKGIVENSLAAARAAIAAKLRHRMRRAA